MTQDGAVPLSGTLYVVATPLGNLEDITLRALRVLREVRLIACEDTRRTKILLQREDIRTPLTSYFEHNERFKGEKILQVLASGSDVALVSDAGTPAVSDPGFRLVRDARAAGHAVIPVPGPSAGIAALSVSGLPSDRFLFVGFLPSRAGARHRALQELREGRETLIFYESPLRLVDCLDEMAEIFGDREAFLCREATKIHEEYRRGRLRELAALLRERGGVKGEVVLVVEGAREERSAEDPDAVADRLLSEGRSPREAAKEAARLTGKTAREIYRGLVERRRD